MSRRIPKNEKWPSPPSSKSLRKHRRRQKAAARRAKDATPDRVPMPAPARYETPYQRKHRLAEARFYGGR